MATIPKRMWLLISIYISYKKCSRYLFFLESTVDSIANKLSCYLRFQTKRKINSLFSLFNFLLLELLRENNIYIILRIFGIQNVHLPPPGYHFSQQIFVFQTIPGKWRHAVCPFDHSSACVFVHPAIIMPIGQKPRDRDLRPSKHLLIIRPLDH